MGRPKSTLTDFISKAIKLYGNKYSYDESEYIDSQTKLIITCPLHGKFSRTPGSYLKGLECKRCSAKRRTTEDFIRKAKEVHGNKYSYDNTNYEHSTKKLTVTCTLHGDFLVRPYCHTVKGHGCIKCKHESKKMSLSEFIKRSEEMHGKGRYIYSSAIYENSFSKVSVICPLHGKFRVLPNSHLYMKSGCPGCSKGGFDEAAESAFFYILPVNGDQKFTGFGISGDLNKRLASHRRNLKNSQCSINGRSFVIESTGKSVLELERHIKSIFGCNNSRIDGFKRESVLISAEELKLFCENYLQSIGQPYTIEAR